MPIPHLTRSPGGWRRHPLADESRQKRDRFRLRSLRPWLRAVLKNRRRFVNVLLASAIIASLLLGIGAVGAFAWFSRDLPNPDKINERAVAQSTRIYARDGTTLLYEIHGTERRTIINLEDIPEHAKNATIVAEDKDFYRHGGISFRGILRAIFVDVLRGGKVQGGSTITQQFVKNAILTSEKSFGRKIRELVLSYQLERKFSKDQILKLYFNEIPYGSTAYGIESASQTYFGKPAKELSIAEGALLAALPKAPTYYSPYGSHTDDLAARQRIIINSLEEEGYITKEQAETAKGVDILKEVKPRRENITAPHFVLYVKEFLSEKYGDAAVERGGLKVTTTLDPKLESIAEEVVKDGAEKNEKKWRAENAALVAIDPRTGQILAMVGSRDYFDEKYDGNVNVALRERNPGSSFKPIVYATAFSRGFTPDTVLFDLITNFGPSGGKDYIPKNYDGKEHGPTRMRQALAGSLNIPAVKTLYLAGVGNVIEQGRKMGYTTLKDPDDYGLALALGGAGIKLLDHTAAFGVFATSGVHHPTTTILKVEDSNGKILEEFKKDDGQRALDAQYAREILSILSDNAARAFIFGARSPLILSDRPVFAKTGTTNDWRDGFTVGGTPSLVAGVWTGNNDNDAMKPGADGVIVAAPIWNSFLSKALKGTKAESFPAPKARQPKNPAINQGIQAEVKVSVDRVTEKKIPDSCLATYPKEFVAEKSVREVHDILYWVDRTNPNGPSPTDPSKDPQFGRWEEPVKKWAKANGYVNAAPPEEDCDLRSPANLPQVSFTQPIANATVSTAQLDLAVNATGPKTISKVEFFLDGKPIGDDFTAPYTLTANLSDVENGYHTFNARATDAIENVGEGSVNVNVLLNASTPVLYLTNPSPGATLSSSNFPVTLEVFAYHPSGVTSVSFNLSQNGTGSTLGSATNVSGNLWQFSWASPPSPGTYQLSAAMTAATGEIAISDNVVVTVQVGGAA